MIKNILVATDSSEHSVRAIACAVELARRFKAEIELFHVIYLSGMFYAADFYSYSLAKIASAAIDNRSQMLLV